METTRSPFLCGNYPIVLLDHMYNRAPPGIRNDGGGRFKRRLGSTCGIKDGGVDCCGFDGGGIRRYVGALPVVTTPLVSRQEDVEHGQVGEGVAVLDGLNTGDISSSLQ